MIKYFHELTTEEKLNIYNKRIPWDKVAKQYPQPMWCLHEHAICGLFGCDELWEGIIEKMKDCYSCKYCENGENYE